MEYVRTFGVRCAIVALVGLWLGSASAAEEVTERAVPNPLQIRPSPAISGASSGTADGASAAGAQISIEQQLASMQQRIRTLETQIATLQSVLIVTPTGATLQAPTLLLQSLSGTTIRSGKSIAIDAGESIGTRSGTSTFIRAGSTALVEGAGTLDLKGASIRLNGGTKPLATVGSQVQLSGQPIGQVITGSPTILGN